MKKSLFTIALICLVSTLFGQYADTTLTNLNWRKMDQSWLFTIPMDTVEAGVNDTVVVDFPLIFSSALFCKITAESDTIVDTVAADILDADLIIEIAPTSAGPWTVHKTVDVSYGEATIIDDFFMIDFFLRLKYIVADGEGILRTWLSMKPSSIPKPE